MRRNSSVSWFVLSWTIVCLVTTSQTRHVHRSHDEPVPPDTSSPTPATDDLDDLLEWLDRGDTSASQQQAAPPTSGHDLPLSYSSQLTGNNNVSDNNNINNNNINNNNIINNNNGSASFVTDLDNQTDVSTVLLSNLPDGGSQAPLSTTMELAPTINELLQVLENFTKSGNKSAGAGRRNGTDLSPNITTVWQLLDDMTQLGIEDVRDLLNVTSFVNNTEIQKLVSAAELANVTSLDSLTNLTSANRTENIHDLINDLRQLGSVDRILGANGTGNGLPIANQSTTGNGSSWGSSIGNATADLGPTSGENLTETEATLNGTAPAPEVIGEGHDELVTTNGTTEVSRLETATNDEFWPTEGALQTNTSRHNLTTGEQPMASAETTTSSLTSSTTADQSASAEPLTKANDNRNNPYFGGLIAALVFGCLFVVILIVFVGRRLYDGYQTRHYTKMDYLVNGMYN